jgi:hypothetical protein
MTDGASLAAVKCEQVLFMLMLKCRCEGGHVDGRVALTILGHHIIRKAEALRLLNQRVP